MKRIFCFILITEIFFPTSSWSKGKAQSLSILPGQIQNAGSGVTVALEKGRSLFWPNVGPVELRDAQGKALASVDLSGQKKQTSGAEAMGLTVEEKDLGGSMANKRYLSGKSKPSGRALDASTLANSPGAEEAGQSKSSSVDGVALKETSYPNGSGEWLISWPGATEKIYWDRKRSMVSNEQSSTQGGVQSTLTQWADGSFRRAYRKPGGEVLVSFDQNDKSFRFAFNNANGETLQEIQCDDTCSNE